MIRSFRRGHLATLILAGFVSGCGPKATEIKPDPALANKPFPKVEIPTDKPAKRASFPAVGERRGP